MLPRARDASKSERTLLHTVTPKPNHSSIRVREPRCLIEKGKQGTINSEATLLIHKN
ncbi:hypothetical protein GQ607_016877 [Colletotrichum asianum]|uniref:Uncharacterized protein n=1 Tax=Colletotrichum asianum TaxID=702518 RepID=A0A8H3VXD3_9PEZI|nr:hypothetical protein GQ607_016877 [Colletotrichum asianum]